MTADTLTHALLVGAARATDSALPPGPLADAASALPGTVSANSPAERLLDALALSTAYAACGRVPAEPGLELPPPADADPRPACSARAGEILGQLLLWHGSPLQHPLIGQWLALAYAAGRRPPHWALADLLTYAVMFPDNRPAIAEAAGPRGRWMNDVFGFSPVVYPSDEPAVWTTGTRDERRHLLRRLRGRDPSAGLELLRSTWREDGAEERALFVGELRLGLGSADEPFLESALDDRSTAVRTAAHNLLACLPGSAFVARMTARCDPCLAYHPARRGGKDRIDVTLPAAFDPAWARDGIVEQTAGKAAPRQQWLRQMLECVPPTHWCRRFNADARTLVFAQSEFHTVLLDGCRRAAERFPDAAWLDVFLREEGRRRPDLETALFALPADAADRVCADVLAGAQPHYNGTLAVLRRRPFGPLTTEATLDLIRRAGDAGGWKAGRLHEVQQAAGLGLPPHTLSRLESLYPEGTDAHAALGPLRELLRLRLDMQKEFAP